MKKNYTIYLEGLYHTSVDVVASSADEAREKVMNMQKEELFSGDMVSIYDIEDLEETWIEENND